MILLFFHQPAVHRDGDHLPRNELPALLECLFRRQLQPAAAGYLHPHDGDALNVVFPDDLRQLFGIVHAVQLGTAHQRDVSLDEPLVEGGVGVGGAVGGNQQPRPVEIGRIHRHQLDLHRPLGQAACLLGLRRFHGGCVLALNIPGLAAGAAAGQGHALFLHFPLLIFHDGLLVIGRRLPLYKGDGPGGAGGQAVTQAVAVIVPHEPRLAVHHGDGALVTGGGAGAAAVALILVDLDDPSFHVRSSCCFCALIVLY